MSSRGILQSGDTGDDRAPIRYIMVVNDDLNAANETKAVLEQAGFEVKSFRDGGQVHGAMTMDRPDLVLLKLILPGESGFEICERLKRNNPYLPILIYTEVELGASQNLAARLGADGYLIKPCEPKTLIDMIHQVADAVWERQLEAKKGEEQGEIRFLCKCGQKLREKLKNRGKLVTCPKCQALVQCPERSSHEMIVKQADAVQADTVNDPMKFLSIKCQNCGTHYKLFADVLEKSRLCPKCHHRQIGALSIVGAPMSRAALATSLRVLRILAGKLKGKKLMLPDREITLGSDHRCELRQCGEGISPRHCLLKPTSSGIEVTDLDSETGVFIDDERISGEGLLEPGGLLRVGSMLFRLVGQNRDVDSTEFFDPKKAKAEEAAAAKGVKLFMSEKATDEEAADVIQAHWDIIRKRSTMKNDE